MYVWYDLENNAIERTIEETKKKVHRKEMIITVKAAQEETVQEVTEEMENGDQVEFSEIKIVKGKEKEIGKSEDMVMIDEAIEMDETEMEGEIGTRRKLSDLSF